ncbi:MAG: desulfoferrodoxin, partial [Lachnospiraceae bacterium]|nr:desulfoferrodoxin [Lachnospiraceae bacterium]
VELILPSRCPTMCCGEAMEEMTAGSVDAALEKHVPSVTVEGNKVTVTVGSVEHPMLAEHSILWIALETSQGIQRKALSPGNAPTAVFALADGETPIAALEYCNLHGLWKKEI